MRWDYPAIAGVEADLVLVTHEHLDHNGVGAIAGEPVTLRSTAGRLDSPIGEVLAVAAEHDEAAGTERGPNTLFAFTLGGRRVAHLGDLGQRALRDEQAQALGAVDLLFVPVGGGPTIGAEQAAEIAARLGAARRRADALPHRAHRLPRAGRRLRAGRARVERLASAAFELDALPRRRRPARRRARRAPEPAPAVADGAASPIENRPPRAPPLQSVDRIWSPT